MTDKVELCDSRQNAHVIAQFQQWTMDFRQIAPDALGSEPWLEHPILWLHEHPSASTVGTFAPMTGAFYPPDSNRESRPKVLLHSVYFKNPTPSLQLRKDTLLCIAELSSMHYDHLRTYVGVHARDLHTALECKNKRNEIRRALREVLRGPGANTKVRPTYRLSFEDRQFLVQRGALVQLRENDTASSVGIIVSSNAWLAAVARSARGGRQLIHTVPVIPGVQSIQRLAVNLPPILPSLSVGGTVDHMRLRARCVRRILDVSTAAVSAESMNAIDDSLATLLPIFDGRPEGGSE